MHNNIHHDHNHDHHHHEMKISEISKLLVFGIVLNVIFVILEVLAGVFYDSLALLSDAGHNFSDVIALLLALGAFKLLSIAPNKEFTYGYRKTTILAAMLNALILLLAVGMIFWESFERWFNPVIVDGTITSAVAFIGIIINGFTAWLFFKDKEKDLNVKGAYLHMMADMLVSVGVVFSGLLIYFTNIYWIDTIVSWVIGLLIVISTWNLLKESLKMSLDAVPKGINIDEIKSKIISIEAVKSVHHIHVWPLSTSENALTAHLVFDYGIEYQDISRIKKDIKHKLLHLNIHHSTLETEFTNEACSDVSCEIKNEQEISHHHHH